MGLGAHDRTEDKEIGDAVGRSGGEKEGGKTRERRGNRHGAGFRSRGNEIFEYDHTARVNRPVRKRAASYTRNAFARRMVGEEMVRFPGPPARRGDSVSRGERMGAEAGPLRARGQLAIGRAISHHRVAVAP